MRTLFLVACFLAPSLVWSAQSLRVQFDETGMRLKTNNNNAQISGLADNKLRQVHVIPFVKLTWSNKHGHVIAEKHRPDPRAFWAPVGEDGKHSGIFLREEGEFVLKKPGDAMVLDVEYYDPDISAKRAHRILLK